jgi:hypothetical protein
MTVSAGSMRAEIATGGGQTVALIDPARLSLPRYPATAVVSRAREAPVPGRRLWNPAAATS